MPSGRTAGTSRPTAWWLETLRRRARKMHDEYVDLTQPIRFQSETERRAAIKFFNAAFRAEESGLRQAHELADEVRAWDAELAEVLELYGNEEGWHRALITDFLHFLGAEVEPMGRVTRTLYKLYARAERMETIVLCNLMFETIGSTTYRLALREVEHGPARHMLQILTRDESFHVPLNVHFLRRIEERNPGALARARPVFHLLFISLLLLPLASRPKAQAFDHVGRLDLMRGYARELTRLFDGEPSLGLRPPSWILLALGISRTELREGEDPSVASIEAAERAADRENVEVVAL